MPLRTETWNKGFWTADLPILPFLAPRVFTPWPARTRKAPLSTHEALKPYTPIEDSITAPSVEVAHSERLHLRRQAGKWVERPVVTAAKEEKALSQESEEFREKYKEIWGRRQEREHPQEDGVPQKQLQSQKDETSTRYTYKGIRRLDLQSQGHKEKDPEDRTQKLWRIDPRPSVRHPLFLIRHSTEKKTLPQLKRASRRNFKNMEEAHEYQYKGMLKRFYRIKAAQRRLELILQNERRVTHLQTSVRSKWVSWKGRGTRSITLGLSGLTWQRRFAFLNARHERFMTNKKYPGIRFNRRHRLPTQVKKRLIEHEDSASLRTSWERFSAEERRKHWPELMHTTLADHPDSALKVLLATYHRPYPPDYALSDCVNFIISHYFQQPSIKTKEQDGAKILNVIFHLLRIEPHYIRLNQNAIGLLIKTLDLAQVEYMYQELEGLGHVFHENTLIHFADKFAKFEKIDLAFGILERLRNEGVQFSSLKMNTLCSTLLEWKNRAAKDTRSDDEVFKFMLESGLQPNIIHYNILIQNACQKGDHRTAWQIHDMLLENGISADKHTYSILLKDAKLRLNEGDIRRVMAMRERKYKINKLVITDLLHATYLLHQKDQDDTQTSGPNFRGTAFDKMLPMYCKYFNIETLGSLIPDFHEQYPNVLEHVPTASSPRARKPQFPTLLIMIVAYLQSARSPHTVEKFYSHYRSIIEASLPFAGKLLRTTHIYNAVIMAFGRFPQSVRMCALVVEDMWKDASPSSPDAITAELKRRSGHRPQNSSIPPDVRTWSILLNIFMLHHQPRAAEWVLERMERQGIEPSLVTWNSLAGGYAALQDAGHAVDVVKRLESKGLAVDKVTMRALSRIKDKRRLIAAMRQKEAMQLVKGREDEVLEALEQVVGIDRLGDVGEGDIKRAKKKKKGENAKKQIL